MDYVKLITMYSHFINKEKIPYGRAEECINWKEK